MSDLYNFAYDNITPTTCETLTELQKTLGQKTESAVSSLKQNEMTVNIDKFQNIESTEFVKLLGISTD